MLTILKLLAGLAGLLLLVACSSTSQYEKTSRVEVYHGADGEAIMANLCTQVRQEADKAVGQEKETNVEEYTRSSKHGVTEYSRRSFELNVPSPVSTDREQMVQLCNETK